MKFHGSGWQSHPSHWDKPSQLWDEVVELGNYYSLLLQRSRTSGELGDSTSLLRPWLWQSPGTFPVKTNGRIVVGQFFFCVGNDTHLLQTHIGVEVFHSFIWFWDTGLQDFSYTWHLSKQHSPKAAILEWIQQGSTFFSFAAQIDLLMYFYISQGHKLVCKYSNMGFLQCGDRETALQVWSAVYRGYL